MGKAGLEAGAGLLVGEAGACHWWVELSLGSLVGRAVSRDMSRGGCESGVVAVC